MDHGDKTDYNGKVKKQPLDQVIEELSKTEYSKWKPFGHNSERHVVYSTEVLGFKANLHKKVEHKWGVREVNHFYIELANEDGWFSYNNGDEKKYSKEDSEKIGILFKKVDEGKKRYLQELEEKKRKNFEDGLSKFGANEEV